MAARTGGSRATAKGLRLLAVLALTAGTSGVLPAGLARADDGTPPAVKTNWWWTLTSPSVNGETLPAGLPAQASTVPDGDLGVGYVADQAGTSDKVAAVALDLGGVPQGSTFSTLSLELPYDPDAHQVATGTPELSACELIGEFADAPGPSDYATVPPASAPSCVKGVYKATVGKAGGYVFDLTAIGNDWSGGAPQEGVLIQPTPGSTTQQPFSLAFLGKNGIAAHASWTAPSVAPHTSGGDVPQAGPVPAPAPQVGGFAPQPQVQTTEPQVLVPSVPAPQANPVPTAAPLVTAAYHQGALVPSTRWWLALLGVAALLGLTALVLGDPLAPEALEPRRQRFAEAIRSAAAVPLR